MISPSQPIMTSLKSLFLRANNYPQILMVFFFLVCTIIFCFMVVKVVKKSKGNSLQRLPPGPSQLPIIGNIHQLRGSLPHHTLRDLAEKYGPLMHLQLGELSTIIVSSPQVAKEIFKTHDIIFSQRSYLIASSIISYNFVTIIFAPYGDYWRQIRKICTMELLSPKRVQTFRSIREEEVLNMMKSISVKEGSIVNLSKTVYSLTYGITARAAFGKPSKNKEEFMALMDKIVELFGGFSIVDMYPSVKLLQLISGMRYKLEKIHNQIDDIIQSILNEHKEKTSKQEPGSGETKIDLVDVLLNIQKHGDTEIPLTDTHIKAIIYDIFSAGSDTSSTIVEWAMSEMIKNPEIMTRAQDEVRQVFDEKGNADESGIHELKFLQAIIKETLRLHPSAPLLVPRETSEQCKISDYEVPAKTRVIVNAWAIGRDPLYWTEPEKFNPDRFLGSEIDYKGNHFEFLPFGAGRRICPGISFAIANIELPLAQLLFHFDWKLPGEVNQEKLDMSETFGATVRRKNHLKAIATLHDHSSLKHDR